MHSANANTRLLNSSAAVAKLSSTSMLT